MTVEHNRYLYPSRTSSIPWSALVWMVVLLVIAEPLLCHLSCQFAPHTHAAQQMHTQPAFGQPENSLFQATTVRQWLCLLGEPLSPGNVPQPVAVTLLHDHVGIADLLPVLLAIFLMIIPRYRYLLQFQDWHVPHRDRPPITASWA